VEHREIVTPFLSALLAALICLSLSCCTRVAAKASVGATEALPVRVAQAVSEDVPLEITAVGNVEAMNSVELKSRVAGQINRVAFTEGQNVVKGQLLFSLDREALGRQIAEEQANLERDTAMERQARAVVARDAAAEKQSKSEAEIGRQLGTLGVISGQRVSQLAATSDTSQAALHADQAAAEAAAGSTRADRARLAETQLQLRFTDVVSPLSGRAGAATVKAGNMVRDNDTTLVTLRQLAPIYVTFGIPEQRLAEVQRLNRAGQLTVEVTVDADADSTSAGGSGKSSSSGTPDVQVKEGHLVFIDNAVDATTGTIRLKASFPNTDNTLWPGAFVHVRLRLGLEAGRTVIPESAVQDSQDGEYVWLVQSGSASTAPVAVLRTYRPSSGPELAIIGSGIKPGATVVTEGQLRLTSGATVTLLNRPGTEPVVRNRTATR